MSLLNSASVVGIGSAPRLANFRLHVRIGDAVVDRFAQRLDDRIRRSLRRAEAEPADAVIAGHELGNGRDVG